MPRNALNALAAFRARDCRSLNDVALQESIFHTLGCLENLIDNISPTKLRHELSEQIVQMRATIWEFDQNA